MLPNFIWIMEEIESMAQCKTAVTPLITEWSSCSLALSRRNEAWVPLVDGTHLKYQILMG